MKVAVYKGVRNVVIEDRPKPVAGPGQAVVKVDYVGICGTDVHAYKEAGMMEPPVILGHETVGTVAEVGEGVTSVKVGDRVAVGPPGNCGECFNCLNGRASICIHGFLRTTGITSFTDGGYAEYLLAKNAAKMLIKIPENLSFEEAVLFDVIGTSFHGIRRSNFKLGDNVVVIGTGPIGLSAIMLLKLGGAGKLIVVVRSEAKAKIAKEYGADIVVDQTKVKDLAAEIRSLTDGKGADITFESAGAPESFNNALQITRAGGQVMLVGVSGQPYSFVSAGLVPHEINMDTSFVYDAAEVSMVFDFLANGKLPVAKKMVTDIIGMDDVVTKGLERLAGKNDQIKILLAPHKK
jgi:threonine dehydrogenase-like Zn-dependent dehydrogenase